MKSALSKWFKRIYYQFELLSVSDQILYGKFKVKYEDGSITRAMDYKTAREYANRFNGTVIDNFI